MKENSIFIKSEHNHEPGQITKRSKKHVTVTKEEEPEFFEIIQL